MAADITITDGANAMTLNVSSFWYDLQRTVKEFSLKSVPGLGAPNPILTDFGAYLEHFGFNGWLATRAEAKTLLDYVRDEWFVNRGSGLAVTIGAVGKYEDDVISLKTGNLQPLITYCKVLSDVEINGVLQHPFELRMAVARRL